jgi:hypothetical protein
MVKEEKRETSKNRTWSKKRKEKQTRINGQRREKRNKLE